MSENPLEKETKKCRLTVDRVKAFFKAAYKVTTMLAVGFFAACTIRCLSTGGGGGKVLLLLIEFLFVFLSLALCLYFLQVLIGGLVWIKSCTMPVTGKVTGYAIVGLSGVVPKIRYKINKGYLESPLREARVYDDLKILEPYLKKMRRKYPIGKEVQAYADPENPDRISHRCELGALYYFCAVLCLVLIAAYVYACAYFVRIMLNTI